MNRNLVALIAFTVLTVIGQAQATSLHPCAPTVRAMPTYIYCNDGSNRYSITIETLMSPATPACQGQNHIEYNTARVKIFNQQGQPEGEITIFNNDFSYTASGMGDATFESRKFSLHLDRCVTPVHGGISFGN